MSAGAGRRALVTGGCGFVGSALCARLVDRGERVTVLDDLRLGSPANWRADLPSEIELVEADVRDAEAVAAALRGARPAVVYHLAALHFIPRCEARPAEAVDLNVVGLQVLLDACAAAETPPAVVFASSGAVYAPSGRALAEGSALGPSDVYGHTKLWGEQLLALHRARTGAAVAVARLFNVFGPGETNPHFVPTVLAQARAGGRLALGDLSTRRDYVFAGDVAEALALLGDHAAGGATGTFNVASGRALSGADVLHAVERVLGRSLETTTDPARMRPSDRPLLLGDAGLAREVLGWRAATTFEEGLRAAIERPLAEGVHVG